MGRPQACPGLAAGTTVTPRGLVPAFTESLKIRRYNPADMRRARLFNVLTAMSLLACLAAAGLWVRAHFVCEMVHLRTGGRWFFLVNYPNRIGLGGWDRAEHDPVRALPRARTYQRRSAEYAAGELQRAGHDARRYVGFAGLAFLHGDAGLRSAWQVTVPYWLVLLGFGFAPARRGWRALRRRPPPGHCPRCAYDLTGNVSGTCPECGAAVAELQPARAAT